MRDYIECSTQADVNKAIADGNIPIVRAYDSATVRAYGSATVRASGSATVRASPMVAVHRHTSRGSAPTVTGGVIIEVPDMQGCDPQVWIDYYGIDVKDGTATVYKGVTADLLSDHGFSYPIGETVKCDDWEAKPYCGNGLHFSPRAFMTNAYTDADRFLEVTVQVADIVCLGDKIKAPGCTVLREVDEDGQPVAVEAEGAAA